MVSSISVKLTSKSSPSTISASPCTKVIIIASFDDFGMTLGSAMDTGAVLACGVFEIPSISSTVTLWSSKLSSWMLPTVRITDWFSSAKPELGFKVNTALAPRHKRVTGWSLARRGGPCLKIRYSSLRLYINNLSAAECYPSQNVEFIDRESWCLPISTTSVNHQILGSKKTLWSIGPRCAIGFIRVAAFTGYWMNKITCIRRLVCPVWFVIMIYYRGLWVAYEAGHLPESRDTG